MGVDRKIEIGAERQRYHKLPAPRQRQFGGDLIGAIDQQNCATVAARAFRDGLPRSRRPARRDPPAQRRSPRHGRENEGLAPPMSGDAPAQEKGCQSASRLTEGKGGIGWLSLLAGQAVSEADLNA